MVIGNTYHWANPLADHVLDLAVKDLANILHQEGCMDACERPTENTAWEKWAWELLRDRIAYHEAQGDQ